MFGTGTLSTTTTTSTATPATGSSPFSSIAVTSTTSTSTSQAPPLFGGLTKTSSNPIDNSTRTTTTDASGASEASTAGVSLKGLLEKEGSVVSACSQLLAMMTADTEISFSDLSAITQKMTLDLAADERAFLNCLLELNAYDRQLWENMQRISDVDSKLATLEEKQSKMIYNISSISEEQKALDSAISEMEKSLGLPDWTDQNSDLPMDAFSATPSDVKRQQLLQLLVSVDSQIKEADCDLQEILDQVSALHKFKTAMSNANKVTEDQVAQILKNQMETLLYIDQKTGELDAKVEEFKEVLDGRNAVS
ncbi:hypothetical protein KIN20_020522 [Parelaphostrongylus tenuis]|uniref:Nucleoporin NSP1-like C-terminal domain-containing protein n=1 Tax=Parelaphostrongylus tenuis TaxID=148309 RepID=A0AAD5MMK5_PARTN|nr:hypothetical protein KIN20_020522 [Parelaphostrongylus tenuis]